MNSSIQAQKVVLRAEYLSHRRNFDSALAAAQSLMAQQALLDDAHWRAARQVALYVPIRGEMDTTVLLQDAWTRKVQVLLPRCRPNEPGHMDFVPCTDYGQLRAGVYGILEPAPDCAPLPWDVQYLCPDLGVIPALAFDTQGFRLGYGGGYYDRALEHGCFARTRTVGLCASAFYTTVLPRQIWDKPVNAICTEGGLQWL